MNEVIVHSTFNQYDARRFTEYINSGYKYNKTWFLNNILKNYNKTISGITIYFLP